MSTCQLLGLCMQFLIGSSSLAKLPDRKQRPPGGCAKFLLYYLAQHSPLDGTHEMQVLLHKAAPDTSFLV